MRIHGSSDFAPKTEAHDGKQKARAPSTVGRAQATRGTDDVSKGAKSPEGPAPAESGEAVVLSASASRMTEVSTEHSEAVGARLAEVKQLLDAGTYEIDFDTLADNLLAEEGIRPKQ